MKESASATLQTAEMFGPKRLENPIISGSLARAIWDMSWPLLTTYFLSSCIGLTDTYLAGFIGGAAQAALGIGEQAIFLAVVLGTGLSIGAVACIARSFGAGDLAGSRKYAEHSLLISVVIGFLSAIAGICFAEPLFTLFGAREEVTRQGVGYLKLCSLGNFPYVIATCMTGVFRAVGAPRYALYLWMLISSLSIGGGFLLFWGGLPRWHMSLEALSISWTAGASIGVIAGCFWLNQFWKKLGVAGDNRFNPTESLACIREVLQIGGPAVVAELVWIVSNFLTYKVFAGLPNAPQVQAGWSIAMKVEESLATMPLLALSMAAATIVGQNLGAGLRQRACNSSWKLACGAALLMVLVGAVLMVFARPIAELFSHDPAVVDYVLKLLKVAPITVPALAVWLILFGALEGAGSTLIPMLCNSVIFLMLRLPLCWLLAVPLQLGLQGVVDAFLLTRVFAAIVSVVTFQRYFGDSGYLTGKLAKRICCLFRKIRAILSAQQLVGLALPAMALAAVVYVVICSLAPTFKTIGSRCYEVTAVKPVDCQK
jgi:putative MATE family efflux protein